LKAEAEKRKAEQAAQAKAKQAAEDKTQAENRKKWLENLKHQAGKDGGSTTSPYNGVGKSAYKPSDEYLARVGALIKRNTNFDADSIDGNPAVTIEVHLSPDGTILGTPRVLRPSGNAVWDAAAVAGIERTARLPRDPDLGTVPSKMTIIRSPKD